MLIFVQNYFENFEKKLDKKIFLCYNDYRKKGKIQIRKEQSL